MFPAASPEAVTPARAERREWIDATLVVVAIYAALQIVLTIFHDPWLDEAQAWAWAKILSSPQEFFILPGEGHPPLWQWLLRALSTVMGFSEARYLSTALAIFNAWLLSRLLRDELLLLVLMLSSFAMLQFWGYHFRPYGIVVACMLGAILLDQKNRPVAATWLMALACGFHFFAGFLFGFWLIYQASKGTRLVALVGPALFAAVFGLLAVISGSGNTIVEPARGDLVTGIIRNLSWSGMIPELRIWPLALLNIAVLAFALRKKPVILGAFLLLWFTFAVATAAVYGKFPWHTAFMTMLTFLAIMVAGINRERRVALAIILIPQMFFGFAGVSYRLGNIGNGAPDLYQAISDNAGPGFDASTQLVAWPDLAGVASAAIHDVTIINGNGGPPLGPVHWQTHDAEAFAPVLLDHGGPFWLLCAACEPVEQYLTDNGRKLTLLGERLNPDNGVFRAYKVE